MERGLAVWLRFATEQHDASGAVVGSGYLAPESQIVQFLTRKGLRSAEIDEVKRRALAQSRAQLAAIGADGLSTAPTVLQQIHHVVTPLALMAGTAISAAFLYRRFVDPDVGPVLPWELWAEFKKQRAAAKAEAEVLAERNARVQAQTQAVAGVAPATDAEGGLSGATPRLAETGTQRALGAAAAVGAAAGMGAAVSSTMSSALAQKKAPETPAPEFYQDILAGMSISEAKEKAKRRGEHKADSAAIGDEKTASENPAELTREIHDIRNQVLSLSRALLGDEAVASNGETGKATSYAAPTPHPGFFSPFSDNDNDHDNIGTAGNTGARSKSENYEGTVSPHFSVDASAQRNGVYASGGLINASAVSAASSLRSVQGDLNSIKRAMLAMSESLGPGAREKVRRELSFASPSASLLTPSSASADAGDKGASIDSGRVRVDLEEDEAGTCVDRHGGTDKAETTSLSTGPAAPPTPPPVRTRKEIEAGQRSAELQAEFTLYSDAASVSARLRARAAARRKRRLDFASDQEEKARRAMAEIIRGCGVITDGDGGDDVAGASESSETMRNSETEVAATARGADLPLSTSIEDSESEEEAASLWQFDQTCAGREHQANLPSLCACFSDGQAGKTQACRVCTGPGRGRAHHAALCAQRSRPSRTEVPPRAEGNKYLQERCQNS